MQVQCVTTLNSYVLILFLLIERFPTGNKKNFIELFLKHLVTLNIKKCLRFILQKVHYLTMKYEVWYKIYVIWSI